MPGAISGCTAGAPGRIASAGSSTNGSTSQSTTIEAQRFLGHRLALGRHHHPGLVAHPADPVAEHPAVAEAPPHHPVVGDGVDPVGPAGAGRLEAGDLRVGVGEDVDHPGQGRGARQVQAPDAGMRIRAAQHPGVEEVGEAHPGGDVVGVEGPARRLLEGVDARPVAADETPGHPGREGLAHERASSPPAACSTARAIPA